MFKLFQVYLHNCTCFPRWLLMCSAASFIVLSKLMSLNANTALVFFLVMTKHNRERIRIWERQALGLPVGGVGFGLSGISNIGLAEQSLNANQNLLDAHLRSPIFIFVQQRQTYGARWINVRMENWWIELALWRSEWVVLAEMHL